MKIAYDNYYQTEDLFGEPYPELMAFFCTFPKKGKVLDIGCGQGRDSIPLAKRGFEVTGIDHSKVGIGQMNKIALAQNLKLNGQVADIFEFGCFSEYGFLLLDSMFHFAKKDLKKETAFIQKISKDSKAGAIIIFCIQDTGKKVIILNEIIAAEKKLSPLLNKKFEYIFEDKANKHKSKTNYRLIAAEKQY